MYGFLSYSVAHRSREFGVRLALGAQRRHILSMILRQGLLMSLAGTVFGFAGALLVRPWAESLLFGVTPSDPLSFASVSLGLICVTLAARLAPAWRATQVDPLTALRHE